MEIGLEICSFSIKVKNEPGALVNLHTYTGEDLIDKIKNQLYHLQELSQIESYKKTIELGKELGDGIIYKENRPYYKYLFFSVLSGEYGIQSTLKDMKTGDIFERNENHTEEIEFYICLLMPYGKGISKGLILLETIGARGAKTVTINKLSEYVKNIDDRFSLKVKPIAPYEYAKIILQNYKVQKVRLVKYSKSTDVSSPICEREEKIYINPTAAFSDKLKEKFPSILKKEKNSIISSGIVEIDEFKADDLKLVVDIDGKSKTIGVNNISSINAIEYITEHPSMEYDENNFPTAEAMKKIMHENAEEYVPYLLKK